MINENCLRSHGAVLRKFNQNTVLFNRGHELEYHFQVVSGLVKLVRSDWKDHKITCKILGNNDANYLVLNESPLSFDVVADTDCTVLIIPKEKFLSMIMSEKGMLKHIMKYLSEQIYDHMETNRKEFNKSPSDKITELCQLLKFEEMDQELFSLEISLELDQIAIFTGLSVEICSATIQKMKENGFVKIRNGKIYF